MKVVTRTQMNTMDAKASQIYKIDSLLLMEHAALGTIQKMLSHIDKEDTFVFVCGSGNNGGDGFAMARLLTAMGFSCAIDFLGNKEHLTKDAKSNFESCIAMEIPFVESMEGYSVIVDGLFGTGLKRKVEGRYAEAIEQINRQKGHATIISIDIPSGIDADTGQKLSVAVEADYTYTMECIKKGMLVYPGRMHSGKIEVVDLLVPATLKEQCESRVFLIQDDEMSAFLPTRLSHSNKGSYGKLLAIGGNQQMSGAISMASSSALSAGVGLLTCAVPVSIQPVVMKNVWEAMSIGLCEKQGYISEECIPQIETALSKATCILFGCGIGRNEAIQAVLKVVLDSQRPLVIDADGLVALKPFLPALKDRGNLILTPHLKEFADLLDIEVKDVMEDVYCYAEAFMREYPKITLVLKSDTTLIGQGETMYVNTYGNDGLATGGSGDVLAGLIAGFYAQNQDALKAAVLGVYVHAKSADRLLAKESTYSILPTKIIQEAQSLLCELQKERL